MQFNLLKNTVRDGLLLIAAALLLIISGCKTVPAELRTANKKSIFIENGNFKAELVNSELITNNQKYGCRFLRAGWIKKLYLKGGTVSIFRPHTVFPTQPTFGYTHELMPALDAEPMITLPDGYAERLKVGVGIIRQKIKNQYQAEPIKLFPWKTTVEHHAGSVMITSVQNSDNWHGYSYQLTVTTVFKHNSPVIEYKQTLKNCGSRTIAVTAYVHPFLNLKNALGNCWYILPHYTRNVINGRPFIDIFPTALAGSENVEYTGNKIPAADNWVAAGNFLGRNYCVAVFSWRPLMKNAMWRYKDVFAVEPFIKLTIAPRTVESWRWSLIVQNKSLEINSN